jgi:hypothetical protein
LFPGAPLSGRPPRKETTPDPESLTPLESISEHDLSSAQTLFVQPVNVFCWYEEGMAFLRSRHQPETPTMEPTTGLILRRITHTSLSIAAHKLATLILDGIAWKDGYNGLPRGTAAFTLAALAHRMQVSRQYLTQLLAELGASDLQLTRRKPHGKYAPWLFRFAGCDTTSSSEESHADRADLSSASDRSLLKKDSHKNVFSGQIDISDGSNVFGTPWAQLIKRAKAALPCWNVDTQRIWDRFLAFNRARGNSQVPAGFLLGFMRKWRTESGAQQAPEGPSATKPTATRRASLLEELISVAPTTNRQFHAADLGRRIGPEAYEERVRAMMTRHQCGRFSAILAVHGQAVRSDEIQR